MIPKDFQIEMAIDAYHVLQKYLIVYISGQERVGKTLTSILVCEMANVQNVLVITKAKAKPAPKKEEVKVVVEDDEEVN